MNEFEHEGTLMNMDDEDLRLTSLPIDFYGMYHYNTVTIGTGDPVAVDAEGGGNF